MKFLIHPVVRHGNALSNETLELVFQFYYSDDISRVSPGKTDVVNLQDENGEKIKVQKWHMVMTLGEAYELFKEDNPDEIIGKGMFAKLLPTEVFLVSDMPHNVCGCRYHNNIILMLECLNNKYADVFPTYTKRGFG